MQRFVRYDWDSHSDEVLESDSDDVVSMKTHEEGKDGDFIWSAVCGRFFVFDTWTDFDVWNNQQ